MKKIKHDIHIGDEIFVVTVLGERQEGGGVRLDGDDLLRAQREVGLAMVMSYKEPKRLTPAHFNFLVSITGLRGKELARYLQVEPSNISQWRREKGISAVAWQAFRVFFFDLFTNGKITNEVLLSNLDEPKSDDAA